MGDTNLNKIFAIIIFAAISRISRRRPHGLGAHNFKDVPVSSEAYESIKWAMDRNLVKGYEDGTFKPNNILLESQFAAVMSRYFNPDIEEGIKPNQWSDLQYTYLKTNKVLLEGHSNKENRNKAFTRLDLAKALYASVGLKGEDRDVIDWMYENKITTGKGISSDKYIDFGGNDGLKRTHVATFFMRMDQQGFHIIHAEKGEDELRGDDLFSSILPSFIEEDFSFKKQEVGWFQAKSTFQKDSFLKTPQIDIHNKADTLFIGNLTPQYMPSLILVSETIEKFGVEIDSEKFAQYLYDFTVHKNPRKQTIDMGHYSIEVEILTPFDGDNLTPVDTLHLRVRSENAME